MLSVAPSSRWQMTRSGFITSMSPVVAIWPAVISPGPVAESWRRLGPSPSMRSATCFTFRTMSVTSSRTPARLENSCSTPSILIAVTAAPCSDERSTRRSELPSVSPKPRSSGSATKVALRRASPVAFFSRALGFFISCQFFALTAMMFPWLLGKLERLPEFICGDALLRVPDAAGDTQTACPRIVTRGAAWRGGRRCAGSG